MAFFKSLSEVGDVVSILAFCTQDNTYMLTQDAPSSEYWIPSGKVLHGDVIKQLMTQCNEIFGSYVPSDSLLRIYKCWVPNSNMHIRHNVFAVKVDQEQKKRSKSTTGKFQGKLHWILDNELFKIFSSNNMRSPELFEMILCCKNKTNSMPEVFNCDGINTVGNLMEMTEQVIIENPTNGFEKMVMASSFTKNVQKHLYTEFIMNCFPSIFMGMKTFCKIFSNLGWSKTDVVDLFRTADLLGRYGVSFREFLYISAAIEPIIDTLTGDAAESRNKLLFRFYDKDNDGMMKFEEMKQIFFAIRKNTKQPTEANLIQKDASDFFKSIQLPETSPLPLATFLKSTKNDQLKNLSTVFRSPVAVTSYIKEITDLKHDPKGKPPSTLGFEGHGKSAGVYELASHAIKIYGGGAMNIEDLNTFEALSPSSTNTSVLDDLRKQVSVDQFNQESITNELVKSLRYMNLFNKQAKGQQKPTPFSWGNLDSGLFAKRLMSVCKLATEILKKEPRLLYVSSPVYVLGDLHGSFTDLLQFESVLWHVGPVLCPSNLLFLGDYVDRGSSSIEVISYLFSYKVQNPKKVNLVRGNHEIREVQKMFTFLTECNSKFGERLGSEVWGAINATFDYLPIAAIVDNTIFCCHGGIPPPWLCPVVSCINEIPVPLNQPDQQSALAWEILWNDPIKTKANCAELEMELSANEGFAVNKRRGTAHMFGSEALERFLKANSLTHVIRGHEVAQEGFNVVHKGKLITVFSCSKYCGGTNDAACIMIDQGRLRVMRIEF